MFIASEFLGQAEEDGNNEHGEEFDEHSAEDGDGHGDHEVGAATGAGEDREEGEKGRRGGHEAGADAPLTSFKGGGSHFGNGSRFQFVELLAEVGGDDDAVIGGDAEKGEESDPDCDRDIDRTDIEKVSHIVTEDLEVEEARLAIEPEHEESTRPGDGDAGKDDGGGGG